MSAYGRAGIEQSIINARKVARAAIRLKHSIEADNELNDIMPLLERRLVAMAQEGEVPSLTMGDIEQVLNENAP